MKLRTNDLIALSVSAITAARNAGKFISTYKDKPFVVSTKTTNEGVLSKSAQIVTEVDIKSQSLILKELNRSIENYDLALLTEERLDDNSRLYKDYFWCIDPLDGTLPFTEGKSGYSVSIALVSRKGTPVIGVIYDAVLNNVYHAVYDEGAFKNGKVWKPKKPNPSGQKLTFVTDRSFLNHDQIENIKSKLEAAAVELGYSGLETLEPGGAAMNAIWALEKPAACYFKFPKSQIGGGSLWDYAASACIYQEIGGFVTDIHGKALELNNPRTTFMHEKGLIYTNDMDLNKKIQQIYKSIG